MVLEKTEMAQGKPSCIEQVRWEGPAAFRPPSKDSSLWTSPWKGYLLGLGWVWQFYIPQEYKWASQVALVVKSLPANAGDKRDPDSIPGSGRSPGGIPLQYCCQKNPMDRGAWRATVRRIAKNQLKWLSMHTHTQGQKYFEALWGEHSFDFLGLFERKASPKLFRI